MGILCLFFVLWSFCFVIETVVGIFGRGLILLVFVLESEGGMFSLV